MYQRKSKCAYRSIKKHINTADYFYAIRNLDRDKKHYTQMSAIDKASRFIYLNKTCYNGLYRVNAKGDFNTPFGRYRNPNVVNEETLQTVHNYLKHNDIHFYSEDFEKTIDRIINTYSEKAFVYLDPPYDPISETSNFTSYAKEAFDHKAQIRLKTCCDKLSHHNIKFMLSNSSTPFIHELYKDYHIKTVQAKRSVNANPNKRSPINEFLIRNYIS